jgi:hypothetical protein
MEKTRLTGSLKPSDIPTYIKKPLAIPLDAMQEVTERLNQGGELVFNDAELIVGVIDPKVNSQLFIAADTFELKNSKIVTNGNSIIIFCRELIQDTSSTIEGIPTESRKASIESQGDSGGEVHIFTTSKIHGKLNVDLSAQSGGDGENGRNGANGLPGSPGADKASGGNGGNAGNGQPGTNGGEGGNGGVLKIHYIETAVQQDLDISFVSKAGTGGKAGQGGAGGIGGRGGKGDAGRSDGLPGSDGDDGPNGTDGKNGVDGDTVINEVKIGDIFSLINKSPFFSV